MVTAKRLLRVMLKTNFCILWIPVAGAISAAVGGVLGYLGGVAARLGSYLIVSPQVGPILGAIEGFLVGIIGVIAIGVIILALSIPLGTLGIAGIAGIIFTSFEELEELSDKGPIGSLVVSIIEPVLVMIRIGLLATPITGAVIGVHITLDSSNKWLVADVGMTTCTILMILGAIAGVIITIRYLNKFLKLGELGKLFGALIGIGNGIVLTTLLIDVGNFVKGFENLNSIEQWIQRGLIWGVCTLLFSFISVFAFKK